MVAELYVMASTGDVAVVRALISQGADVNERRRPRHEDVTRQDPVRSVMHWLPLLANVMFF